MEKSKEWKLMDLPTLNWGALGYRLKKMNKIQHSKALNADLKNLHLILQTVESHVASNYVIVFHTPLFYKGDKSNFDFIFQKEL